MDPLFPFIHAPVPVFPTFPTPSQLIVDLPFAFDPVPLPAPLPVSTSRRVSATTDPDSISSHEKKRHYLECIEHYIQFLHQQLQLLGEQPPHIDRVASYRGLSSRSIRTLLVHMEHNTRKLTQRTRDEEQRFVSLRNELQ